MERKGTSAKSIFLSVLLHLGALALLIFSFNLTTRTLRQSQTEVVQAVAVDSKEIDKELQKLQEIDKQKQEKQLEAERKLQEAEDKRRQEETRLAEMKKQQALEQQKREAEQKKLAEIKKQQEDLAKKQKLEEEKKLAAEAERKRKEQEAAQAAEAERLKKEKAAAEAAAQARQDQQFLSSFAAEIKRRVSNNFNISGLPPGLKCVISVRVIPGGEIINAGISRSSGNEIFDQRALVAVQKASPLPVPPDAATLDRLKLRQFTFEFSP